ncbi:hypothetical protein ACFOU2_22890 [Bacillus songklensis]|uniref:Spore germination protein gerPA/gerPF n=1 Tax=Bacillus songklensis TaxID=1069116 RepID=A0ABV8BAB8_9BACI
MTLIIGSVTIEKVEGGTVNFGNCAYIGSQGGHNTSEITIGTISLFSINGE